MMWLWTCVAESPTFKQWIALELTGDNRRMLYIPKGCAHGFQTLEDNTEVFYQMSEFYHPESACGVRWNDPALRNSMAVWSSSDPFGAGPSLARLPGMTRRETDRVNAHFEKSAIDQAEMGREMHAFIGQMYPLCRSITGAGFRETLSMVNRHIPIEIHEVPTGTPVFDWTVPKEWNIRDAYVKNRAGERVIDFRKSNLHVVSYSVPIKNHPAAVGIERASLHPPGASGLDSLQNKLLPGNLGILSES